MCCSVHSDVPLIEDFKAGDMICSECASEVGDRVIDESLECCAFNHTKTDVDLNRVADPENPLPIVSEVKSESLDAFQSPKCKKSKTVIISERSLISEFNEISTMADRLNLPKTIVDRANNYFKQVFLIKVKR